MTDDELKANLVQRMHEARWRAQGALGSVVVLTLEGMGLRIVPDWMAEAFMKALSDAARKTEDKEKI